ncbi:MAG: zf-HC2 domain-containing protein [Acidobacteriaceae bacterium]|nr:zf-HC2 domain-containing protein [Acidobacteriaceae bacterium]MBV9296533.1 zf-HC2 domain-containing protein [Acidobacteriaceae bacterium]MBV9763330.1 zf-HC2 domain-containing protein [Acidobacteriaceae bacterium]
MTCWGAKRQKTEYMDGRLRDKERSRVKAHLENCDPCFADFDEVSMLRLKLQNLAKLTPPKSLRTDLRVDASREQKAVAESHGSRIERIWRRWKTRLDDFMRPLTIPATGGLLSSIMLFGVLGFTIGRTTRGVTYEVPILFAERTDANLVPVELRSAVVLTLSLDGSGRITDYAVRDGSDSFVGSATRLQYNNISLPEFPSVLAMTQPISRDIRISFTPIVFRR